MKYVHGLLFFVMAAGLATTASSHAGEALDVDAEAKQAAQEEADQLAERAKGVTAKYQRKFYGIFSRLPDAGDKDAPQLSPDVVGTFATNASDRRPGRNYLVKVENGNKAILAALVRLEGKQLEFIGKLRNISPDGEAKYVIVSEVQESAATPRVSERRKAGGL